MKSIVLFKPAFMLSAASLLLIASCTKSDIKPTSAQSSQTSLKTTDAFANDADFTTSLTATGNTVVRYRPGPNNGQDVYTDLYGTSHSGNQNYVPELPVNVWDYAGGIVTRSFIRFPKLDKLSTSSQIVSAKLYLYPPKDFLNHPQGNTGPNECVIQRVLRGWTEDGLTWDNQPREVTDEDEAFIPPSTDQYSYKPVIDITALIQKIVSGEVPNYGFRITLSDEKFGAAVNFASSEAEDGWRRPMLEVEYK